MQPIGTSLVAHVGLVVVPVTSPFKLRGAPGDAGQVNVNQNEHLMVWMRPAAQPSFRKLWAVIGVAIPAGGDCMYTANASLLPPQGLNYMLGCLKCNP